MVGFFIGMLVAMLLMRARRRYVFGRMRRGLGSGVGRGPGRRFMLRRLFSKLQTDAAQEREIEETLDSVQLVARELRLEMRDWRYDLAEALRSEDADGLIDEAIVDELAGKQRGAVEQFQETLRTALGRIHLALNDTQRAQLADVLEHRGGHRSAT